MKRLVLSSASRGIAALPLAAGRDVAGMRFAFVPTAAGPDGMSQVWVQDDLHELEALGCVAAPLDLAATGPDEVAAALAAADGVLLCGGNAYLLLWHARRSGFAEQVVPLVESGRLLYAGTSAGSVLAGPDLAPAASEDNRAAVPELDSSVALALVGFTVLPHDGEEDRVARYDELVASYPELDLVRLTDDHAVVVRGEETEIVDARVLA